MSDFLCIGGPYDGKFASVPNHRASLELIERPPLPVFSPDMALEPYTGPGYKRWRYTVREIHWNDAPSSFILVPDEMTTKEAFRRLLIHYNPPSPGSVPHDATSERSR